MGPGSGAVMWVTQRTGAFCQVGTGAQLRNPLVSLPRGWALGLGHLVSPVCLQNRSVYMATHEQKHLNAGV